MSELRDAVVVYDSVHGNTRRIAEAVAEGVRDGGPVQLVAAADADPARLRDARAVVLGCPTHAFSFSPAMKAFVAGLAPGTLAGVPVAVFDTRFEVDEMPSWVLRLVVRAIGRRAWAATGLRRVAARAGATDLGEPVGFIVRDTEGPLADGEIDRARAWGRTLAGVA
jgi:menaquinone-dependent protoporphyrinogen IX oxidase